VFIVCISIPLVSLSYLTGPRQLLINDGFWPTLLIALGYWILPLAIAAAAISREFSVVPLFLLECVLLLTHSIVNLHHLPQELQLVRYLSLLGALLWFALIFLTKDSLYPLLAGNHRAWRLAPRLYASIPLQVWLPNDFGHRVSVVMNNCSITGMGFEMSLENFERFFGHKKALGAFILFIGHGEKTWMLNARISRIHPHGDHVFLGMEIFDSKVMRSFIDDLFLKMPAGTVRGGFARIFIRSGVQQAAIALWGLSLFGFFLIPSCTMKSRLVSSHSIEMMRGQR